MALVDSKKMFEMAYKNGYAIGAFNVNNMEITQGIISAIAEEKAPLILQISRGARKYASMSYLRAIIDVAVAENPDIPIVMHLDHGDTLQNSHLRKTLRLPRKWLNTPMLTMLWLRRNWASWVASRKM